MSHMLFPRNGNYITVQKSDIHVVWFLDIDLIYMIDIKSKKKLPYAKVITKILNYHGYDFREEEYIYVHTNI